MSLSFQHFLSRQSAYLRARMRAVDKAAAKRRRAWKRMKRRARR